MELKPDPAILLALIAKAKADGKYKGREPTAVAKTDMVKHALDQGIRKVQKNVFVIKENGLDYLFKELIDIHN